MEMSWMIGLKHSLTDLVDNKIACNSEQEIVCI